MIATRPSPHTYASQTKSNGKAMRGLPPSSGAMVADIAAVTRNTYGAMRKTGVVVVL